VDAAFLLQETLVMTSPADGPALEARHSAEWYGDGEEVRRYRPGDSVFLPCKGGRSSSRLETFPPRLEIPERGGIYVLVDDGPVESWYYQYVGTFDR